MVYLTNEETELTDVYFGDFQVTHTPTIIAQTDSYYPFGLSHGNMSYVREGRGKNQFLYNGKELVEGFELGWYDYGARNYSATLGRFFNQDRFAEKYHSNTPYHYALNNPINFVDINGDSVWVTSTVSTENFDNGTSHTTINHTIHITGKVLDLSDASFDVNEVTAGIADQLNGISATERSGGNGVTFTTNISVDADIQVAGSMDDVAASDHLLAIVDNVTGSADPKGGGGPAAGLASRGGKIAYIEGSSFGTSGMVNNGVHEIGHNLGLGHNFSDPSNFMSYSHKGTQFNFSQLNSTVLDAKNGRLNQGSNFSISGSSSNNILWHRSTNTTPYDFNIQKGQKTPKILKN
jgi:RHS repeat-associated protein